MIDVAGADRLRRRRVAVILVLLLAAAGAFAATAFLVSERPTPRLGVSQVPGSSSAGPGSPGSGATVPAADLVSDPVFVNSTVGFALETPQHGNFAVERLARSDDAGRTWRVTGSAFPVDWGFSALQFISPEQGYVFGHSGLLDTTDGGVSWHQVTGLNGTLQRAIPIGEDVWATYTHCPRPGIGGSCSVGVAISTDGGSHWHDVSPPGLQEAPSGGDVLARWSLQAAYVLSYGSSGGGLAYTGDDGRRWTRLADPCSGPSRTEDLADPIAPAGDVAALWLVCGALTSPRSAGEPKLVYRSFDGGRRWQLVASTGFTGQSTAPVGRIPLSGWVSQLATIDSTRAWLGIAGLGVIVTRDSGATWSPVEGIPTLQPDTDVGVTFNSGVLGWAIVFRRGVWRTADAERWQLVDGT